jgi:hypothetical protein
VLCEIPAPACAERALPVLLHRGEIGVSAQFRILRSLLLFFSKETGEQKRMTAEERATKTQKKAADQLGPPKSLACADPEHSLVVKSPGL